MSDLLVGITSQSSDAAAAGFTEVNDLVETVDVPAGTVVLLMAVVPLQHTSTDDETADFRFAIDDVLVGPEISAFKDNIDASCGVAICWAATGLSGSTKFALQWRNRTGTPNVATDRLRSLTVISITDASLLFSIESTSAQSATSGYDDVDELTATQTPASADSILLMMANMNGQLASDNTASFQFTVGGSAVGPESKAFEDSGDEGCGMSHIWVETGHSGSTDFALQWDELQPSFATDTGRVRSFQVIEITANVNILTAVTSVAADALTGSFTDVVDLVDTVTVQDTDSILLFMAMAPLLQNTDRMAAFRFFEGGTGEGPEQQVFADNDGEWDEACGHSVYHAVTGKSSGSHTFSLRGINVDGSCNMSTEQRRSLAIIELTAAVTQVDKEAADTLGLAIDPEAGAVTALLQRQESIDLAIIEGPAQVAAGIVAADDADLALAEDAQLQARADAIDDLNLATDEGPTDLLARADPVDTTGLAADDVAALLAAASRLDGVNLAIGDVAAVVAALEALDTVSLTIDEATGQIAVMVDAADTLALALGEVAELLALLGVADTLSIIIDDAGAALNLIARSDTLALAIDDAGQVAVQVTAADQVDLAIGDVVSDLCVALVANDILGIVTVEAAELLAFLQRADTLALALVEGAPVIVAGLAAEDTLGLDIIDQAAVQVPIEAADVADLAIDEVAQLVAVIQATDLLALTIDEIQTLAGFLNRADIAGLQLGEDAAVLAFLAAEDKWDLAIADAAQVVAVLEAADSLEISIAEVGQVLIALSAIDTLGLTIAEAPADVFRQVAFEGVIVQPFTLVVCREAPFTLQVVREVQFTLQIEGSGEQIP